MPRPSVRPSVRLAIIARHHLKEGGKRGRHQTSEKERERDALSSPLSLFLGEKGEFKSVSIKIPTRPSVRPPVSLSARPAIETSSTPPEERKGRKEGRKGKDPKKKK